jgi:hypothetical protein
VVGGGEVGSYTISRGRRRVRYRGKQANAAGGGISPEKCKSGDGCFESGEVTVPLAVGCGHKVEGGGNGSCAQFGREKWDTGKKGATAAVDSFYTMAAGRGWGGGRGPVGAAT